MLKILCVGPQWRGSNAAALFKAFSRLGHVVDVVDENYFINLSNRFFVTKVIDKLFFRWHAREFNSAIKISAALMRPDLVLVYKGAFIFPETITALKKSSSVVNVYPDVSYRTHGSYLPKTLPLYDWIFTTKTFGIEDMKSDLKISSASFIPHGFDPEIHRPLESTGILKEELSADVSFIGTHSLKKEKLLTALISALPQLKLKVWGNGWERATTEVLKKHIQYKEVLGDLYPLAINESKINLGILSEVVKGASSGDLITSRTFHIPASGGFMLHERTVESVQYYEEGIHCAFFKGEQELIDKVTYYLYQEKERLQISASGRQKALSADSIDYRAEEMLLQLKEYNLI